MNWDETRDFLSPCFPECIRDELAMLLPGELREIRIRAERPAVFVTATRTAKLDWIPGQMQVEARQRRFRDTACSRAQTKPGAAT